MSTRVKIAIAAAIVAALVGLIVLDQRSATPVTNAPSATPDPGGVTVENDLPRNVRDTFSEATRELERAAQNAVGAPPPAPSTAQAPPPRPQPAPAPAPAAETYEVKEGDTLCSIAERAYGDPSKFPLIMKANPSVKPNALRIGTRLQIPPKQAPAETAPVADAAAPAVENGRKTYVIQPNDSLEKIAVRFYKNARAVAKLLEANRDVIENPDTLTVGAKIVLPEIAAQADTPVVTPGDGASTAAAGRKTYRVKSGDSLWKIARQFAAGRSVMEVMERIREANADKLASTGTPLQVDWVIVIPE